MKKNRNLLYFLFIILSVSSLYSQNLYLKDNIVNEIFNPNYILNERISFFEKIDLYQINQNPASLLISDKKTGLFLSYNYDHEKGDFRRTFDEEKKDNNQPLIDITYRIDTNQAVHGNISFYEKYSTDRAYVENRFAYRGNPYLLADENPGDYRLDMLNIETEYSRRIFKNTILGVQLSYSVGEGLKKTFPKPTSLYRDLGFRIGLNYEITENHHLGIFGEYFNLYEEIDFGDNLRNPVFIKFRGLDYPGIFAGLTSLTRLYVNDGWGGGLEYQFDINDKTNLILSGRVFSDIETVTDGITFPKAQGRWKENQYEFKIVNNYQNENYSTKAGLLCEINNQKSARPILNETMLKKDNIIFSPFFGFNYKFSSKLEGYILYQPYFSKFEAQDYTNLIKYDVPVFSNSVDIGLNYDFSEYIEIFIKYNFFNNSPTINNIETSNPTNNYFLYFEPDIKYEQTSITRHGIKGKVIYHFGILGDFGFIIDFDRLTSETDKYRNYIKFSALINLFIF